MKIEHDLKLDFSDVLIRPKRSTLESRNDINLEREFKFPHSKQIWKGIPIIASNMDTVGTVNMYNSLNNYNMLTCFHKFLDIDEYPENTNNNYNSFKLISPLIAIDTIYIGYKQFDDDFIPIGLDKNNNNSDKIFFNTNGSWEQNNLINGS